MYMKLASVFEYITYSVTGAGLANQALVKAGMIQDVVNFSDLHTGFLLFCLGVATFIMNMIFNYLNLRMKKMNSKTQDELELSKRISILKNRYRIGKD